MAKKYLKKYRLFLRMGYSVRQSRALALFTITCGKRGAANLRGQSHARKYSNYWGKV